MIQNFSFETNIEKRMPDTGKVFFVDRMTSDYAKAHPFNVDEFIEQVYQQFAGTEFEESREAMHKVWTAVLSPTNTRPDISLYYPNNNGERHPALLEVWLKAGDYMRRGLRSNDVLPAIVPACKVTRLGDEWIALFQKDMALLDAASGEWRLESEKCSEIVAVEETTTDSTDNTDNIETVGNQCSPTPSEQNHAPVELDLFAQMQMEVEELRTKNLELRTKNEELRNMIQEQAAVCSTQDVLDNENRSCETQGRPSQTRRQRRERRREQDVMALHTSPAITVSHDDDDHSQRNMKIFAAVATAAVFLVLVNTIGLFGVAALGLLAGGLLK